MVDALESRGVTFKLESGNVKIRGWKKCSEGERQRLRDGKAALVDLLRADEATLEPEPAPLSLTHESAPPEAPPMSDKERTARRLRPDLGMLTERGNDVVADHLKSLPDEELNLHEVMFLRGRFARRFGGRLNDRW